MPPCKTSDIKKALLSKGFTETSTHHEMYWYYFDGKKTSVRTRLSHGSKEYHDGLLSQMARQLYLSREELDNLIACPLTAQAYQDILIAKGKIIL